MSKKKEREISEHLQALRDIVPSLPPLEEIIRVKTDGYIEYDVGGDIECYEEKLLSNDEITVSHWFCGAGGVFPDHVHDTDEWFLLYEGKATLYLAGEPMNTRLSKMIFIPARVAHSFVVAEDTHGVFISISAGNSYTT